MVKRRVYDTQKHIHFVTFSCYKRRKHLQHDQAKRIVIGTMGRRLAMQQGLCLGFVIMPDHVHALLWFPETLQLSQFMSKWKELTSKTLKTILSDRFPNYWSQIDSSEPIWQPRYYGSGGTPRPARWVWPEGTATTNAAPGQSSGAPSTAWRQ